MKKVAIYARVSSTTSNPENQLIELRQSAKRNDWIVVKEYVDFGVSGAKGRDKWAFKSKMLSTTNGNSNVGENGKANDLTYGQSNLE